MIELNRDIHVWDVNLDRQAYSQQQIDKLSGYLNEQERQRVAKFINPVHGDRWTVARGYLRSILSYYLELMPAQINFNYGAHGKPELEGNPIRFNLSHSRDRAVYAISAKHSVGIDIEYIHNLAAGDLVDRFFSPAERTLFHRLPTAIQQAAFFHAWTQKEAYLKAEGTGLSTPLDRVEVSIDPRMPARIINAPTPDLWQIYRLKLLPEYAGAIAIGGEFDRLEYIDSDTMDI
jgi:4'-phosphopantetheinyl transferase